MAEHLAARYTVALYDRRGFSRSDLEGPQDYDRRLATDADDLRRLVEHLSDEPAVVFGASSGAIVTLELLTHHPDMVRVLVPFEPPAVRLLPNGQKWVDFFFGTYDLYHRSGAEAALKQFREETLAVSDRLAMARAIDLKNQRALANATYWFEHELRQYPATDLDLDLLAAHAERIVMAVGRESRGRPCREATVELGERLGRQVVELPGGHVGAMTEPLGFASELVHALADR
ncbi:alpha/beta hydrolase [Actinoallomurus purpureus]|nr:alpha/beta hydrolase [Actinoallomurus purpureus]